MKKQERKERTKEGRINLLKEVWNNVDEYEYSKGDFFICLDSSAARRGKLDMLKWFET